MSLAPEKPSLPSIQFLLQQDACLPSPIPGSGSGSGSCSVGGKRTPAQRHQASRSFSGLSSLPSELQNLSLQQPYLDSAWGHAPSVPQLPQLPPLPISSSLNRPVLPPALPALPPVTHTHNHPTHSTHSTHSTHHDHLTALASRRPPGASHGRSFSDHSLFTRPSHQTHRRAASANTADIYQKPYPIRPYTTTTTTATTANTNTFNSINNININTPSTISSAGSCSPSDQSHLTPLSPHQGLFDALNMQEKKPADTEEESLGRYCCTFCHKKFSRPSSLRIHTYSHTGEKPFVCTEENCGRKFSVQSNMRRHLRVHRLGKSTKPIPTTTSNISTAITTTNAVITSATTS